MEFLLRSIKKDEFETAVKIFAQAQGVNMGLLRFRGNGNMITAVVQDSVTEKLTGQQIGALKAIR